MFVPCVFGNIQSCLTIQLLEYHILARAHAHHKNRQVPISRKPRVVHIIDPLVSKRQEKILSMKKMSKEKSEKI